MQPTELRALRSEMGWTQAQLAEALGLSRKAISNMEDGLASIERRTELATLYLAEKARASGK